MSENTPPPEAATPERAVAPASRHSLAEALAAHLHAILVGVFTLASSVISALLGYYFAHEDRQSMMALEYDKLRAEHTLEIVRALTEAEAHVLSVSVEGSQAQSQMCGLHDRIKAFAAQVAKAKPLPELTKNPDYDLDILSAHLRAPDVSPEARDALLFEHGMLKDELQRTGATAQARLKAFHELARKLNGDTAATMRVYHRDRGEDYMKLTTKFLQLNIEASPLLSKLACGDEAKWDALTTKLMEWNVEATTFSESLGIAIKPK